MRLDTRELTTAFRNGVRLKPRAPCPAAQSIGSPCSYQAERQYSQDIQWPVSLLPGRDVTYVNGTVTNGNLVAAALVMVYSSLKHQHSVARS
eukprot:1611857-Rhodomonas_salina.6